MALALNISNALGWRHVILSDNWHSDWHSVRAAAGIFG